MKTLSELLKEVDALFPKSKKHKIDVYSFSLNRNQRGLWQLGITDDWHKWLEAGHLTNAQKYLYETPEEAVTAFLAYVRVNKINVKKLAGD